MAKKKKWFGGLRRKKKGLNGRALLNELVQITFELYHGDPVKEKPSEVVVYSTKGDAHRKVLNEIEKFNKYGMIMRPQKYDETITGIVLPPTRFKKIEYRIEPLLVAVDRELRRKASR